MLTTRYELVKPPPDHILSHIAGSIPIQEVDHSLDSGMALTMQIIRTPRNREGIS
jgi:hypothetical protein